VIHVAVAVLCGLAVVLTAVCSLGVLVMKDVWQRLHFLAPPCTLAAALLALAIGLDAGWIAALKPLLVLVLLSTLNGVVTHALARAAYVRAHGAWPPPPEEADR
jgi:monovalent cation/proton antiporter MnhG/PhaG subunit